MKLEKLEIFRKEKGLTREELSKLSGVHYMTITSLENGINDVGNVKLSTLVKLAKALHCKVIDFFDKDLRKIIA